MKNTSNPSSPRKSSAPSKKNGANKSSSSVKKSTANQTENEESGLMKLFTDQLKDIYWAEKALVKAIQKMTEQATSEDLISALEEHGKETESQVTRCEEVFAALNLKPEAKTCEAMKGLIEEANEIMKETEEGATRDAGIICAAQKIEHYEIATYGCLATWASMLGEEEAAGLLAEILDEEKNADQTLTDIAESVINEEATADVEDEE